MKIRQLNHKREDGLYKVEHNGAAWLAVEDRTPSVPCTKVYPQGHTTAVAQGPDLWSALENLVTFTKRPY